MPIQCYGLKWSYEAGMTGRHSRGPVVRLNEMLGVYALYDREGRLAYIGRSGRGKHPGIGGRLYYHRVEKKLDFDTYSWFGVLHVSNEGTIIHGTEMMSVELLIDNLEALLIHLAEPAWNGNGGTYKHIPHYHQVPV